MGEDKMSVLQKIDCDCYMSDFLEDKFGDRIRADKEFGYRAAGSLCNIDWTCKHGNKSGTTFRSAGQFISEIYHGDDNADASYLEFYRPASAYWGIIDPEIEEEANKDGWTLKR